MRYGSRYTPTTFIITTNEMKQSKDWKDTLRQLKAPKRQAPVLDPGKQKKMRRLQYKRRKINHALSKVLKKNIIRYRDIVEIHERFGIKTVETNDTTTSLPMDSDPTTGYLYRRLFKS